MMGIVSSMGFGTAPISGFDHMISHALDFEGLITDRKLSLHSAQVGLGATYDAFWQRVDAIGQANFKRQAVLIWTDPRAS
ncbi:MAG: hypothetical protein PVH85_31195 [Desulfobacterales bacterium]|jgi:hypothetical protein